MIEAEVNISADLKEAVEVMRRGGVILYPTDTVWGLGCDATNPEAVARIYEIKRRVESKSMLALVSNEAMLERYVEEVPEIAWQLIEAAVNPLTIIYDQARGLAPNLIGQDGSIGIRITGEKYSRELCQRLRKPVVSTSANISGEKAPAIFAEIADEIKESVDYIAAYRRDDTSKSAPSSIIKLGNDGVFKIIR